MSTDVYQLAPSSIFISALAFICSYAWHNAFSLGVDLWAKQKTGQDDSQYEFKVRLVYACIMTAFVIFFGVYFVRKIKRLEKAFLKSRKIHLIT